MSFPTPNPDRRARRSRQAMLNALMALLNEKEYNAITIAEIADRADVSRPTFYLHFKSKDELLLSFLDGVFDQFYTEIAPLLYGEMIGEAVGTQIFVQIRDHAALLNVLSQARADMVLVERFHQYILRVFSRFLEHNHHSETNPQLLDFAANYLAGATWIMLRRWLDNGMQPPAENMGHIYYELIQPGLTNVLLRGAADSAFPVFCKTT